MTEPNSPLSHMCLAITSIIDAALAFGLISEDDHAKIHTATWTARINATERAKKEEAA